MRYSQSRSRAESESMTRSKAASSASSAGYELYGPASNCQNYGQEPTNSESSDLVLCSECYATNFSKLRQSKRDRLGHSSSRHAGKMAKSPPKTFRHSERDEVVDRRDRSKHNLGSILRHSLKSRDREADSVEKDYLSGENDSENKLLSSRKLSLTGGRKHDRKGRHHSEASDAQSEGMSRAESDEYRSSDSE